MGLADYEEAVRLMNQHQDLQNFVGPRDEALVQAAENALGLKFPATYRRFLLEYGTGNFDSSEVFGVVDDDFTHSSGPYAVWCTLNERAEGGLPNNLVVIYSDGAGAFFCLDCADKEGEEAPVVAYYIGFPAAQQPREVIAEDFGEFLLQLVKRQTLQLSE